MNVKLSCARSPVYKSRLPQKSGKDVCSMNLRTLWGRSLKGKDPLWGMKQLHRASVFSRFIFCMISPQKMLSYKKVALRAQRVFRTRPSIPRGQPGVFGAENLSPDRPNTVSNADRSRKRSFFHMQEVIYILSSRPLFNPGANLRIVPILTKLEQN